MLKNFSTIKKCPLFINIKEQDLGTMLNCLSARARTYEKSEFIFNEGESISKIGIVLSGSVNIIKEDFWGNRSIISQIESGDLFGESFTFSDTNKVPITAISNEKTDILFIDYTKIISTCSNACDFHTELIRNMLKILANKNIMLTQKIDHLTRHSTREKLLSYLSEQSRRFESSSFTIPFNRQELADYLSVDRSAMSNELCKMRDEGLISFDKSNFTLH